LIATDYEFAFSWGGSGTGAGQFEVPKGITVDERISAIYVSDWINCNVQKFTLNGEYLGEIGIPKSNLPEGIGRPGGLAVDSQGYLYVADYGNKCVKKFDSNGNFITILNPGRQTEDVGVDKNNYVYILAWQQYIDVYSPQGDFVRTWNLDNQYRSTSIDVDRDGFVYASYGMTANIVDKYTNEGERVARWNTSAVVQDIYVDALNYIYLSEIDFTYRIVKLDPSWNFICEVIWPSGYYPQGSTTDKNGYLYVATQYQRSVRVYRPIFR